MFKETNTNTETGDFDSWNTRHVNYNFSGNPLLNRTRINCISPGAHSDDVSSCYIPYYYGRFELRRYFLDDRVVHTRKKKNKKKNKKRPFVSS